MVAYNQAMRIKGFGRSASPSSTPGIVKTPQNGLDAVRVEPNESEGQAPAVSKMEHLKRHSLAGLTSKKDKDRDKDRDKDKFKENRRHSPSPVLRPQKPANRLEMIAESPPNIFYGSPEQSTGALFSGQLRLTVVDPEITLDTFEMKLNAVVTSKRPVGKDCPDCITKTTQLHQWTFIKEPKHLKLGEHLFPFSYLLPGHLPTTTHGHIGILQYFLDAKATTKPNTGSLLNANATGGGSTITMRRELPLYRAMAEPRDKGHIRVFPPTNLATHVSFAPVIFPIGEISVHMRINGCVDRDETSGTQMRWRLRKMTWKLEEKEVMISPACAKHSHKVGGEGKGIQHEEIHIIGQGEMKAGWKTDFSDGTVEMEFSCRPSGNTRPLCDVVSPSGLKIKHDLIIELVISEEWARNKTPDESTPTGSARVLRMQFAVLVTERAGMGISWDEEAPPMYGDVPASPPVYPQMESEVMNYRGFEETRTGGELLNYTGPPLSPPPISEEEMASFQLGEPSAEASRSRGEVAEGSSSHQSSNARGFSGQPAGISRLSLEDLGADR